jgi:site-specific recombinase XerD
VPSKRLPQTPKNQRRRHLVQEKGQKPATIALTLSVIRRFYAAALAKGLVKENPAVGIKPPREKVDAAERITYLDEEELKLFLASIPHDGKLKSLRDRSLLGIMALQGPRTVELHRANFGDLVRCGSNWGLRVEGKRNVRTIPLRPDLSQVLWQYLEAREFAGEVLTPKSPLFIAVGNRFGGQRLSRRGIRWIVDEHLMAASLKARPKEGERKGVEEITSGRQLSAHSLRHTAGTLGLRKGADLRQVQDLLGHKDPKTTALYAHVNDRHAFNPALGIDVDV